MGLNIELSDIDSNGNRKIKANGVELGTISILWNNMLWSIEALPAEQLKFSIKNEERLSKILQALIKFKDENGYEDLWIRNCIGDIGTFYPEQTWNKLGFELAENSACYEMKTIKKGL